MVNTSLFRSDLLIVIALTFFISSLFAELPKPTFSVSPCNNSPVIDGKLNDPCWQNTGMINDFAIIKSTNKTLDTEVKFCFDSQWLYIGVKCKVDDPQNMKQTIKENDGAVFKDDSVEIFIDPGTKGKIYYHYQLSCGGVKGEQRVVKGKKERAWNLPWASAVEKNKDGWNAEIAIPLYNLSSYGNLEDLTVNISRNKVTLERDACAVIVGSKSEHSSWSPVVKGFHEPEQFGSLKGLKTKNLSVPFLPILKNARVTNYYFANGKFHYDVLIDLATASSVPGTATVLVCDTPVTGNKNVISKNIDIKSVKSQSVRIPVPVNSPAQREIEIKLKDAKNGKTYYETFIGDTSVLKVMSSFADRSYYTDEPCAVILCDIGLPPESLKNNLLQAKLENGIKLGENRKLSAASQLKVDLSQVPVGTNIVNVELCKQTGELFFKNQIKIIKKTPKPGYEWKIDKINRVLLNNGKPFFSIGIFMGGVKADDEKAFQEVAEAGFNTVVHWQSKIKPEEIVAYHKAAEKYNLYVIGRPTSVTGTSPANFDKFKNILDEKTFKELSRIAPICTLVRFKNELMINKILRGIPTKIKLELFKEYYQAQVEKIKQIVAKEKNFKNLSTYYSFDEPDIDKLKMYIQGRKFYQTINKIDGYHPIAVLYTRELLISPLRDRVEAADWCDILGTDPYWTPAGNRVTDSPNLVAGQTHKFDRIAANAHKVVWVTLLGELTSHCHKRIIKPEEQLCQTYLALIAGAKGVFYFRYPFANEISWDSMKETVRRLKVLGPTTVNEIIHQTIDYSPIKLQFTNELFPNVPIHAALFRKPDRGYILLAANAANHSVDAYFSIPELVDSRITRLFSKEIYQAESGIIKDKLEPFAVRAYEIEEKALKLTGKPVRIKIKFESQNATVIKEESLPRTGRQGKKNVALNPSFEEMMIPGIPDYYRGIKADPENPYHGKVCAKLAKLALFYLSPQHNKPTQYILSLYLRSNKENAIFGIYGYGTRNKLNLTKHWKRYQVNMTVPPKAHFKNSIRLIKHDEDAEMWVDALQFEQAETPTEFED